MFGHLELISSNATVTIIAAALPDTPVLSQAATKFHDAFARIALNFSSDRTPQSLSSFEDEAENNSSSTVSSNCELLRVLRIFRLNFLGNDFSICLVTFLSIVSMYIFLSDLDLPKNPLLNWYFLFFWAITCCKILAFAGRYIK